MTNNYLDAARQGSNKWWQYALELVIAPLITLILIVIITIVVMICSLAFGLASLSDFQDKELVQNTINAIPSWGRYMLLIPLLSSVCGSMLVGIEIFHHRNALSVICPGRVLNIKRYFNALIIWLLMSLFFNIFQYISNPQAFKLVFEPIQWLACLVPAIIFSFVFALFQEIVRGYIIQGLGLIVRQKFLLIFISGFLSILTSLSSSKSSSAQPQSTIFDFIFCIGLAAIILKEHGLELVLGIQTASSLLRGLISYRFPEMSASSFPSVYVVNLSEQIHPSVLNIGIVLLLIKLAVFYATFLRKTKPDLNVSQNV